MFRLLVEGFPRQSAGVRDHLLGTCAIRREAKGSLEQSVKMLRCHLFELVFPGGHGYMYALPPLRIFFGSVRLDEKGRGEDSEIFGRIGTGRFDAGTDTVGNPGRHFLGELEGPAIRYDLQRFAC